MASLLEGQKLGSYKLVELVGNGGFGHVFKATKVDQDEKYALKVSRHSTKEQERDDNGKAARRIRAFEKEYQLLKYLQASNHPNIPSLHSSLETVDGRSFFAMEFLARGSVDDYFKLKRGRRRGAITGLLSTACVWGIAVRVLNALIFMHDRLGPDKAILHLDVKPGNIMIADDPCRGIVLIDFSLARTVDFKAPTERDGVDGSIAFLGKHVFELAPYSRRDDLEALGLTMVYLLLGGWLPWLRKDEKALTRQIVDDKLPEALANICGGSTMVQDFLTIARALKFDERPDYHALINKLCQEAGSNVAMLDWDGSGLAPRQLIGGDVIMPAMGPTAFTFPLDHHPSHQEKRLKEAEDE